MKDLISTDESSLCFFYHLPKSEVFKKAFLEANSSSAWVSVIWERRRPKHLRVQCQKRSQFASCKICNYQVLDSLWKSDLRITFMIYKQEMIKKQKIKFETQILMNKEYVLKWHNERQKGKGM